MASHLIDLTTLDACTPLEREIEATVICDTEAQESDTYGTYMLRCGGDGAVGHGADDGGHGCFDRCCYYGTP